MSKEKVVRKTLEDVVGASRDDIEDVMWGDSFRDGLGSKNDGRKNERTLESLLAYQHDSQTNPKRLVTNRDTVLQATLVLRSLAFRNRLCRL